MINLFKITPKKPNKNKNKNKKKSKEIIDDDYNYNNDSYSFCNHPGSLIDILDKFRRSIGRRNNDNGQQDAHEFLLYIIDNIHEEMTFNQTQKHKKKVNKNKNTDNNKSHSPSKQQNQSNSTNANTSNRPTKPPLTSKTLKLRQEQQQNDINHDQTPQNNGQQQQNQSNSSRRRRRKQQRKATQQQQSQNSQHAKNQENIQNIQQIQQQTPQQTKGKRSRRQRRALSKQNQDKHIQQKQDKHTPKKQDREERKYNDNDNNKRDNKKDKKQNGWKLVSKNVHHKSSVAHKINLNKSLISILFGGEYYQMIRPLKNKENKQFKPSVGFQPFITISLDINNNKIKTIQSALQIFLSKQIIEYKNGFPANKLLTISESPYYLIIHLKRFIFDNDTQQIYKLNKFIGYDKKLTIGSGLLFDKKQLTPTIKKKGKGKGNNNNNNNNKLNKLRYELRSVIVHQGDYVTHGHYICYCRREDFYLNKKNKNKNHKWWMFDDKKVKSVDIDTVKSQQDAYVLFYQKVL